MGGGWHLGYFHSKLLSVFSLICMLEHIFEVYILLQECVDEEAAIFFVYPTDIFYSKLLERKKSE